MIERFRITADDLNDSSIPDDTLRSCVARIERLEEEKSALSLDINEVYAEAKGQGLDVKILRKVIALRRQSEQEREEIETLTDLYLRALDK